MKKPVYDSPNPSKKKSKNILNKSVQALRNKSNESKNKS
jgi:hypothetical protein